MLHTLLMIVHFFCAAGIVALVLLQRGKGAEAGAGFGAGASGTVFGARGASTALSRATAILAAIFMVTSLSLAYVGARKSTASSSLLDQLSQQSAPATAAPATGSAASGTAAPVSGTAAPVSGTGAEAAGASSAAAGSAAAPSAPSAPSSSPAGSGGTPK